MGERDERRDRNIPTVIVRPQSRQVWYATFCHGGCVTYGLTMRPFSWECFVRYPHLFVYDVFFSVEKKNIPLLVCFINERAGGCDRYREFKTRLPLCGI